MSLRNARSKQACFQGENREPGITAWGACSTGIQSGSGRWCRCPPIANPTTEIHLGNLVVQDIPDPTVQISNGYVGNSGKTVTIYFESFSGRGIRMTIG